jgi:hypothetical protein
MPAVAGTAVGAVPPLGDVADLGGQYWGNTGLVGPVAMLPDPPLVLIPYPSEPGFVRPVEIPPDPADELRPYIPPTLVGPVGVPPDPAAVLVPQP